MTTHLPTQPSRRHFLQTTLAAAAAVAVPRVHAFAQSLPASPGERLGIGIIGAGGRGGELARQFAALDGSRVVAVADPDRDRAGKMASQYKATAYTDLRKLLDDPSVDAVAIATCNHWHCLAAIWAMQAGKDVYVEKPLSHSQWEGRKVVEAARKYNKIVQVGTQQRSDPMQAEIKAFLHDQKALGEIRYAQANRLGVREPIGRRQKPLPIPPEVAYDLWLGPAQNVPLMRDRLHYDWHWDWNTGSGEMGNWGVHVLDDVRNVVYQDSVSTPSRIMAIGGRVAWEDAGDTPNVHYALFETDRFPTLIALSNLAAAPDQPKKGWSTSAGRAVSGPGTGYVVVCEGGYYLGSRGRGEAVDRQGKTIRTFKGGDMVRLHVQNFLTGVRQRDPAVLLAEAETGHYSTGWCNLANVGFAAGGTYSDQQARGASKLQAWPALLEELESQLKPFQVGIEDLRMSPILQHDPKTERFVGDHAEAANVFLKRQYRAPYVVPETV